MSVSQQCNAIRAAENYVLNGIVIFNLSGDRVCESVVGILSDAPSVDDGEIEGQSREIQNAKEKGAAHCEAARMEKWLSSSLLR